MDGSSAAEIVLPYAEELAAKLGAEIFLVSVSESGVADIDHLYRLLLRAHHATGTKPLKERGLSISTTVVLGLPADQIIDYAEANAIDLIAMSTHGRSGIGQWVFGSVTDKVLHAGDTAVLVVRAAKV